jgi:Protein of unknown function (DUF1761)
MSHLLLVNYKGVLLATLATFLFGMGYYMSLAKIWANAHGYGNNPPADRPVQHIIGLISLLVMSFMFYGILSHMPKFDMRNGLISALLLWIGFLAAPFAMNYAYHAKSLKAYFIDATYWLGVLILNGLVMGYMGKA